MVTAGSLYKLKVNRFTDNGAYLIDDEFEEVLLPNRYVTDEVKQGDEIEVFIYHDSEDRLVAITDRPTAMAGQFAGMRVVGSTFHGAFLDWGLPKDLFVPNVNQHERMVIGEKYVIMVELDRASGRLVGSSKIGRYLDNEELTVEDRDEVDIIVAQRTDIGYRVIVNSVHWGMIYHNQIFKEVAIGDSMKGYIKSISEDNRIDILLQREGFDQVKDSGDDLLKILEEHGGELPIGDKSEPEDIYRITNMSKKLFKRTAGHLYKNGKIEISQYKMNLKDFVNKG